jgi:16S rRNA (adenine1518-N6/adenine1519-N6)-dimethyltransferase
MAASRRRKRLGQHFLTEQHVLQRIIDYAELEPDDVVLEIGPGLGALTRRIAPHVKKVIAIELDPGMLEELERRGIGEDNVQLIHGDAAKTDYAALGAFNKVVANLPYSASSPITFALFEARWDVAILMYQLEFAQRLVADERVGEYGRLSAARAYHAKAKILQRVGRGAFTPPPDVDSAIVRLDRLHEAPFQVGTPGSYAELLRVLFSTRRKTLRATLRRHATELGLLDWARVEETLVGLGVADRRPEELEPRTLGALDARLEALRHA